MVAQQVDINTVLLLPKYYEFGNSLEKEKRNEKNKKLNDERHCRRPSRKKPCERNYHEEKTKELAPIRKVSGLDNASNAVAVDGNAAYADDGKELVLYGEREISEAERSSNDEVISDLDKKELFLVGMHVEKDDHLDEPTDDTDEITESEYEEDEDREEEKPRKRKRKAGGNKMTKKNLREPSPPQDISEIMQQTVTEIGGTTPVWLYEKVLFKSDTTPQQGRLFLPPIVKDFLTPDEIRKYWVLKGDKSSTRNKEKKEYTITLVEPDGKKTEIDFKIWASGNDKVVGDGQSVLTGSNWNALVRKYKMQAGTKLQFWCFRNPNTNQLCIAMNNNV